MFEVNKLIEGNCLEKMKDIPDKSINMILCDLPYGITENSWDSIIPLDKLWTEYKRIIVKGGVICLTSSGIFTSKLILSNEKQFKYKLIWVKSKATNFLNAKKQPLRKHEDICIFYDSKPTYNPQMGTGKKYKIVRKDQQTGSYGDFKPAIIQSDGERYPTDVIHFSTAETEGKTYHSTQKPLSLGRYLIKTYTNPGDVVLDNAFGSGSFLVSAVLENRNFYGIELNQDNSLFKGAKMDLVKIAKERILEEYKNLTDKTKLKIEGILK